MSTILIDAALSVPLLTLCSGGSVIVHCDFTDITQSKGLSTDDISLSKSMHGTNIISGPKKKGGMFSGMFKNKAVEQVKADHNRIRKLTEVCYVIRDGLTTRIPASEIVMGDLLVVKPYQRIYCDCVVAGVVGEFRINSAVLTGENVDYIREPNLTSVLTTNAFEARNAVLAGSVVTQGVGYLIACAIGDMTYKGQVEILTPPPPSSHVDDKTMIWYGRLLKTCEERSIYLRSEELCDLETLAFSKTWIILHEEPDVGARLENMAECIESLQAMGINASSTLEKMDDDMPPSLGSVLVTTSGKHNRYHLRNHNVIVIGFSECESEQTCDVLVLSKDLMHLVQVICTLQTVPKPEGKKTPLK